MNTCSVRDKAEDKVYSLLGAWRELKRERPHVVIGVGGCVASQEGEAILGRAPYVDLVFGPQTIHRLPRDDRGCPPARSRGRRRQLSRDREVRPPAGAARDGQRRVRLDHGRLQQVLQLLRGAVYAGRGDQPAREGRDRGDRVAGRAGRGRDHAARPERECVPGHGRRRRVGPRAAHPRDGRDARHPAHPLHHVAPAAFQRCVDRRLWRGTEAREPPAPAGAERVRPHPRPHAPRLPRRRVQGEAAQAA